MSNLSAETYNVGFCVSTSATGSGSIAFNDNDYVNGWVMVTND